MHQRGPNPDPANKTVISLTAEEVISKLGTIFAASLIESNGRPRKHPFLKALATVKQLIGVPDDGVVPEQIFNALRELANEHSAQANDSSTVRGGFSKQFWSHERANRQLPKIYSDFLRKLAGKPRVSARIACIKYFKERMGIDGKATLPAGLIVLLLGLERQLQNQPTPASTNSSMPPKIRPKNCAKKKKVRQASQFRSKLKSGARPFHGRFQELPESSVWTGAPWDHSFAEYRWK